MFVLHLLWGIIPAILLSAIGTIISFEKRGVFLIKSGSITRFYTLSTLTVLIFLSFTYLIFRKTIKKNKIISPAILD